MFFKLTRRDGPARIGEITFYDKKIKTPNILYIDTDRFKSPNFADMILTNKMEETEKPGIKIPSDVQKFNNKNEMKLDFYQVSTEDKIDEETIEKIQTNLFIIRYASQLLYQPRNFVNFIIELRRKIGYQKIIYLPSVGDPTNYALFTYLGVDLFDSTSAIINARKKTLFIDNEKIRKGDMRENPCNCQVCSKIDKKTLDMDFEEILNHNYNAINSEIKNIRNMIYNQNLRNSVERKIRSDPNLTTILRILDGNHFDYLEKRTSLTSKSKVIATTSESINRPDIIRFQNRVIDRYEKPKSAEILLLLPCSARKPYYLSRSHKLFRKMIMSNDNPFVIHEVILTSPIGIVPRELELVYPASNYDIPVTGVWDEMEKKLIVDLLTKYLKRNKYEKIIVHLPQEIVDFIKPVLNKPVFTCNLNPTSDESLEILSNTLIKTVGEYQRVNPQDKKKEEVECLASYQFGKEITSKLMENIKVMGKYPNRKIFQDSTQLGIITEGRGLISLTMDGAMKLGDTSDYSVEIFDDFKLSGSVLAPGVKNADEKIRIGDEVVIIKNNEACGVGVAMMSGEEMKKSSYGQAVNLRHKI
jgi:archaeosine synthase